MSVVSCALTSPGRTNTRSTQRITIRDLTNRVSSDLCFNSPPQLCHADYLRAGLPSLMRPSQCVTQARPCREHELCQTPFRRSRPSSVGCVMRVHTPRVQNFNTPELLSILAVIARDLNRNTIHDLADGFRRARVSQGFVSCVMQITCDTVQHHKLAERTRSADDAFT
jgi:hypothetical protein